MAEKLDQNPSKPAPIEKREEFDKLYEDHVHAPMAESKKVPEQKHVPSTTGSAPYMSAEWLDEQENNTFHRTVYDPEEVKRYMDEKVKDVLRKSREQKKVKVVDPMEEIKEMLNRGKVKKQASGQSQKQEPPPSKDQSKVNVKENQTKVEFDKIRQDYQQFKRQQLGADGRKEDGVNFDEAVNQIAELKAKQINDWPEPEPQPIKIETPKFDATAYPSHKHKIRARALPAAQKPRPAMPGSRSKHAPVTPFSILEILQCHKLAAVTKENYLKANELKQQIEELKAAQQEVEICDKAKKEAIQVEDFMTAHEMKVKGDKAKEKIKVFEFMVMGERSEPEVFVDKEKDMTSASQSQLDKLDTIEPPAAPLPTEQEHTQHNHITCMPPVDEALIKSFNDDITSNVQRFYDEISKEKTPLKDMPLAKSLSLGSISVKDESQRFGGTHKTVGVLWTMACMMCEVLRKDVTKISVKQLRADFCLDKGSQVWVSCTDLEGGLGRAMAISAKYFGQKSHIYCPRGMVQERISEIERLGARIFQTPENYNESIRIAEDYTCTNGYYLLQDMDINAFTPNIPLQIMQGYTIIAKEALEQMAHPPTHIFIQAGTGSLAAAIAAYISNKSKSIPKIIIVEPKEAACFYESAQRGQMTQVSGDFSTMCAGLTSTRPNTFAWSILRDTASAFVKFDNQIAGNGMRLASAFGLESGESGAVGLGILHQILTHEDAYAKGIAKLLELNETSHVLLINTDGNSDAKNHAHQQNLPINPGKIQLLMNEMRVDFSDPKSYRFRQKSAEETRLQYTEMKLNYPSGGYQKPVVQQKESPLVGRNKVQQMIREIYLNDYGKKVDLIPPKEDDVPISTVEDDHISQMPMPGRKTMPDIDKDYFEKVLTKDEVWDEPFSKLHKSTLADYEDKDQKFLEKELDNNQNVAEENYFCMKPGEKAELKKKTIGEILADIDKSRAKLDDASKMYEPVDYQKKGKPKTVKRGETIGITPPNQDDIDRVAQKQAPGQEDEAYKTWGEYNIDNYIDKIGDFDQEDMKIGDENIHEDELVFEVPEDMPDKTQDGQKNGKEKALMKGLQEEYQKLTKGKKMEYVQKVDRKMPIHIPKPESVFKQLQQKKADIDTIPASLKPYFFATQTKPNLIEDYDVLGFDCDHCLVKYNITEYTKFFIELILDELCLKHGYPEKIKDFDYEKMGVAFQHVIWDMEKGTFLKLNANKKIIHAVRGFTKLSPEAIENMYGYTPVFDQLNWKESFKKLDAKGGYYVCQVLFDLPKFVVAAQVINLIQLDVVKKTYLQLAYDILDITSSQWLHYTSDEVTPIASFGRYFPEVVKNPTRFIQPQPELRKTLESLKSAGKELFVCTNAHVEYMELIMTTSFGPDWKDLFTLCIANAQKPLFMKAKQPFLIYDPSTKNLSGGRMRIMELVGSATGASTKIVMQGNACSLATVFQALMQRQVLRFGFFGDHFLTDTYAMYELNQTLIREIKGARVSWDAFQIIEEMSQIDNSYAEGKDAQLIPHSKEFWGPSHFMESKEDYSSRNYFVSEISLVARYAVPFLKNIKHWIPKDSIEKTQGLDIDRQNGLLRFSRELFTSIRSFSTTPKITFQWLNQATKLTNTYIHDPKSSPSKLKDTSFFDFFQLPRRFDINTEELKEIYKAYQKVMHPDAFQGPGLQDKANALSSFCSVGYKTLLQDEERAQHLLKAHYGIEAFKEGQIQHGQIPDELFEVRMSIDQTKDRKELVRLQQDIERQYTQSTSNFRELFDSQDYKGVQRALHKAKYMQSALKDIEKKLDAVPAFAHNQVIEIESKDQLEQLINSVPGLVIDFFAKWCGPCMTIGPFMEEKAQKNHNRKVHFCKVDVDKHRNIADQYKVTTVPQFNFIKDGKDLSILADSCQDTFESRLLELEKFCGFS